MITDMEKFLVTEMSTFEHMYTSAFFRKFKYQTRVKLDHRKKVNILSVLNFLQSLAEIPATGLMWKM